MSDTMCPLCGPGKWREGIVKCPNCMSPLKRGEQAMAQSETFPAKEESSPEHKKNAKVRKVSNTYDQKYP